MEYQTVNRRRRASELRRDARANESAGYPCLAEVNWQEAEWIDPTPRKQRDNRKGRN